MFELRNLIHIEDEKLNLLVESVRKGIPIKYACHKAQIPEFYYFKWLKLYNDYIKEIEAKDMEIEDEVIHPQVDKKSKKTMFSYTPVSLILKIKEAYADFVISHHEKINNGDRTWTASAWLLERRVREEYGKDLIETENTNQVQSIKVVYVDSKNEETQERLERLEKEARESLNGTNRD